eukprot:GHVT01101973.1.p1 GENE.GHVT01101973.1~~GHVT01101973.1.p1  ORF type:complete len:613 (+),score=96.10 GHVT01101973.1:1196-3034(+)
MSACAHELSDAWNLQVYAMWRVPTIVRSFVTHAPVSSFILKGADLMLPGVIVPKGGFQPPFNRGDKFAVRVVNNRFPLAIGSTPVSSSDIARMGMRGRGVDVVHYFGDYLWQLGNKSVPNDGFAAKIVNASGDPDETYDAAAHLATSATADSWEESAAGEEPQDAPTGAEVGAKAEGGDKQEAPGKATNQQADRSCHAEKANDDVEALADQLVEMSIDGLDAETAQPEVHEAAPVLSPEQLDKLLDLCFLEVLHSSISDEQLPLEISAAFSKMATEVQHVVRSPAFFTAMKELDLPMETIKAIEFGHKEVALDLKKSTYKKLTKFIQHQQKLKLLQVKETRGSTSIVKINRAHPIFIAYKAIPEKVKQKTLDAAAAAADPNKAGTTGVNAQSVSQMPLVLEFLIPPARCQAVFTAVGKRVPKGAYFSSSECRDVLTEYLAKHILARKSDQLDASKVLLDNTLAAAISLPSDRAKAPVPKEELFTKWMAAMAPCYGVVKPGVNIRLEPPKIIRGTVEPVQISVENRFGGRKHVTQITGLSTFHIDSGAVAEYLQKKLACSCSTYLLPGAAQEPAVMIQGNAAPQTAEALTSHFHLPARYINAQGKKPLRGGKK